MTTTRALDPALLDALKHEWLKREWEAAAARNRANEARRQYQEAQADEQDERRAALMERLKRERGWR